MPKIMNIITDLLNKIENCEKQIDNLEKEKCHLQKDLKNYVLCLYTELSQTSSRFPFNELLRYNSEKYGKILLLVSTEKIKLNNFLCEKIGDVDPVYFYFRENHWANE